MVVWAIKRSSADETGALKGIMQLSAWECDMAQGTTELDAAWMRDAILVLDRKPPSRRSWSRWMTRALAPHERDMVTAHQPIAAIDIEPGASEAETIPPSRA
jgi:hypothetical protein